MRHAKNSKEEISNVMSLSWLRFERANTLPGDIWANERKWQSFQSYFMTSEHFRSHYRIFVSNLSLMWECGWVIIRLISFIQSHSVLLNQPREGTGVGRTVPCLFPTSVIWSCLHVNCVCKVWNQAGLVAPPAKCNYMDSRFSRAVAPR